VIFAVVAALTVIDDTIPPETFANTHALVAASCGFTGSTTLVILCVTMSKSVVIDSFGVVTVASII
jgi:hypothetical protein